MARRHAEYFRDLFERAETERETRPTVEWLAVYGRQIDNVRTALDWAFSPRGDASIGVALTAAAVPLWFQQSLLVECRGRAERALASLGPRPGRDARREMQLRAALGVSLMHTKGAAPETIAAWTTVLEIAERLADTEYQLRALWGLWHFHASRGECRRGAGAGGALPRPGRHRRPIDPSASGWSALRCTTWETRRMRGSTSSACSVAMSTRSADRTPSAFNTTRRCAARMILARILWLQGFPDQARRTAQENVEDARAIDHALSLCNALEVAVPGRDLERRSGGRRTRR